MWLVFKFDTLTLFFLFFVFIKAMYSVYFFYSWLFAPTVWRYTWTTRWYCNRCFSKRRYFMDYWSWMGRKKKKTTKTPPYKITKMNYKLLWTACFHSVCDVHSGVCVLIFFLRAFASWSTVRCWKTPVKTLPSFCIKGRGLTKPPSVTIWARGKQY